MKYIYIIYDGVKQMVNDLISFGKKTDQGLLQIIQFKN